MGQLASRDRHETSHSTKQRWSFVLTDTHLALRSTPGCLCPRGPPLPRLSHRLGVRDNLAPEEPVFLQC